MVQEYDFYAAHFSLVHSKSVKLVQLNSDIINIYYAIGVKSQVTSLAFPISVIVRRNNSNFLTKRSEAYRKFVHHYTKTANC